MARPWPVRMTGMPRLALRRTLRMRLALLYAALLCVCAAAVGAAAVIFKPNFLIHSAYRAAPGAAVHTGCQTHSCTVPGGWAGGLPQFLSGGAGSHNIGGGLALLAILVVLALGAGWLLAGRVVRPLHAITSSAQHISASNLHQRLGLSGPGDEFTELGETLDDLFARLEASFESQRRFVANASHELRTPLAAERTLLQVALADPGASTETLRSACQEALALGEQQETLIGALLTLATSERGLEQRERFDLAAAAEKVIMDQQPEADRRGIRVDAALRPAPVDGDPQLAGSLLANLVDNAIRHSRPGGHAEVSVSTDAGQAVLTVSNTGEPVPPGEVDRLFQPFQRLGAERVRGTGGHGLGLAIVRAIADAHRATLTAAPAPSGGLTVQVTFPPATPAGTSDRRGGLAGPAPGGQ
jgi:signal transduction histidine kinase